eukprot:TRINITY_DN51956_c0_g1_i1.p1 TRINITY_DN51956_c0_g1~~TRINITY_DN51956_c0_g1_i1.p1  ORF type:complete len:490 (-),score=164.62 TRINITY_DN51956_c0_g1_i1:84-1553(-)
MAPLPHEPPFPAMSPSDVELSEEAREKQSALRQEAADALEEGSPELALEKMTAAIDLGCATALMYSRRAELLLRIERPRAAVNDCTAALAINANSAKAYKTRARAHAKLQCWADAQSDFQEGLKLDYDEDAAEEARAVAQNAMAASEAAASALRQRWEVVGGAEKGGILVRTGADLKSKEAEARLSTGALVEELELVGERLKYRRLAGSGPDEGWISISLKDKVLACRVTAAASETPLEEEQIAEDELPFPAMPPDGVEELSDELREKQSRLKQEASEASDAGDQVLALERLTEAISIGCASALMYSRRAEMLLRAGRPQAAVRDCTAALSINPDSGKAFKTRARANVKLKRWTDAHADFQEGLKIDYDEATYEESITVATKMKEITAVATARRLKTEEAETQRKQQQARAEQESRIRQQQAEQLERAEAEAEKAKAMARVMSDPLVRSLHQKAKRDGYMADFMGVKRGGCRKCSHCEVYLWRPVKLNS